MSRSQHLPEKELEEKLGALLPPQLVEVVKKQAKLLPPDPLMEEVSELLDSEDAILPYLCMSTSKLYDFP